MERCRPSVQIGFVSRLSRIVNASNADFIVVPIGAASSAASRQPIPGAYAALTIDDKHNRCDRDVRNRRINRLAIVATMKYSNEERRMETMAARVAKYNFGRLIDTALAKPVVIKKHGRPVVVVLAVDEYHRLKAMESKKDGA
jgi:prevent-host-death family protein